MAGAVVVLVAAAGLLIPLATRPPARPLVWHDLAGRLGPLRFPHAWGKAYRSRRDLADALAELSPRRPLPRIDFARDDAVLASLGPRSSTGYGVVVLSVREEESRVLVTLSERAPALGQPVRARLTFPYRLLAIPHTGKRVSLRWRGR